MLGEPHKKSSATHYEGTAHRLAALAVLLLCAPAAPASASCLSPPGGLVGWWSGDGHTFDLTTNRNNGSPLGGLAYAAGMVGPAFAFDGASAVMVPYNAGYDLSGAGFAVACWVKANPIQGLSNGTFYVLDRSYDDYLVGCTGWSLWVSVPGGSVAFCCGGDGGLLGVVSTNSILDGLWHHLAGVWDGSSIYLYVDATLQGSSPLVSPANNTMTLNIGHSYAAGGFFSGEVDEVAIFNRALSASEITAIYSAGSAGMCKALQILAPPQSAIVYAGASNAPMSVVASGTGPLGYQWQANGANVPGQTGVALVLPNPQPGDAGQYTVAVTDATGASVTSAVAVLSVLSPPPPPAWNWTNSAWTGSGSAAWFLETNVTYSGLSAAQSGLVSTNQSSTLQTTVIGPGTLTFWWNVSSLANSDYLSFQVNGTLVSQITGTSGTWQQVTQYLGSGPQLLQWTYSKAANGSAGADAGWLDQPVFTPGPTAPIITAQPQPTGQSQAPGMDVTLLVGGATGTPPLTSQWQFNNAAIAGATGLSLTVTNLQAASAGNYNVVFTNLGGTTTSSMAVLALGPVGAWGNNGNGQAAPPLDLSNVVAVAAGSFHGLALRTDGTVAAWGDNTYWQTNVPAGLSNVAGIAAGYYHSVALKADGTVVTWGNGTALAGAPAGVKSFVGIAGGGYHTLGLTGDGTVVAWGDNYYGQTKVPVGLSNVVAVAAGGDHSLALKADGTVTAWGRNGNGQTNVPAGLSNVVGIAAGYYHSLALKADGTVAAWGYNYYGQASVPAGLSDVVAIAAGLNHSLALKGDGTVVVWGQNSYGSTLVPAALTNVVAISGGDAYNLVLYGGSPAPFITTPMDDRLAAAGDNIGFYVAAGGAWPLAYQWRLNGTNLPGATGQILSLTNWQAGMAGSYTVVVSNNFGTVTSAPATLGLRPMCAATQPPGPVTATTATLNGMAALNGTAACWFQWGADTNYGFSTPPLNLGAGHSAVRASAPIGGLASGAVYHYRLVASNATGVVAFGADNRFTTGMKVWTWGNPNGSLGPVPSNLTNVVSIACGHGHSLALKADGTVAAWGNAYGIFPSSPATVPAGLSNVIAIAGGYGQSLAVKSNGTVVAWGEYMTMQSATVPAGLSNVIAVAAGDSHALALRADGTVVAWGNNQYGQINVPAGLGDVVAISSGSDHCLALRADGTVVAWGDNGYGETSVPAGLGSATAISTEVWTCLALKPDGTVAAWGDNNDGDAFVPSGLSNVAAIASGMYQSLAVRADGSVVVWGDNSYGQRIPPVGLGPVVAIASGDAHCLALGPVTPLPLITAQPQGQFVVNGGQALFTVFATSVAPLSYQWQRHGTNLADGANLTGSATSNLTVTAAGATDAGNYTVIITNAYGGVTSAVAVLSIGSTPSISGQPVSQTVLLSGAASFSVQAGGSPPLAYRWFFNGANPLSGIITTLAGTGMAGYSGDGWALAAKLNHPYGVAADRSGNLFIADSLNNRVRKVSANDNLTTVAGTGTVGYSGDGIAATGATLDYPAGLAVDSLGNLFIADTDNQRVRKVDTNGIITTVAGTGAAGYSGDGGAAISGALDDPEGVAVDSLGNLFIADTDNQRVRKVDTNGIITTAAGTGVSGYSGDAGAATNAELCQPTGVALDNSGNLFIADSQNNCVRLVDTNGLITTVAGTGALGYSGDGWLATFARLQYPRAVALDNSGNLFIADDGNSCIRLVDPAGFITTVAGTGSAGYSGDWGAATSARLSSPPGVAVDNLGHLFIADYGNSRIRKVTLSGPVLTLTNIFPEGAGAYSVVVSSPYGSVTSVAAFLTVAFPSLSAGLIPASATNPVAGVQFRFAGAADSSYVLEYKTDLSAASVWTPLVTNGADANGNWTCTITNTAAFPAQYFRVTTP